MGGRRHLQPRNLEPRVSVNRWHPGCRCLEIGERADGEPQIASGGGDAKIHVWEDCTQH